MSPKLTSPRLALPRSSTTIAALAAILLLGTFLSLPKAEAAAPTRAAKLSSVNKWMGVSLNAFIAKAGPAWNAQKAAGTSTGAEGLDWSNDGCSISGIASVAVSSAWSNYFAKACTRHDLGYRNLGKNLGKGLALKSIATAKTSVDAQLNKDMTWMCNNVSSGRPGGLYDCLDTASRIYIGVKGYFGKSSTSFFNGECTPGALCLFDDKDYKDRRITISSAPKAGYPVDITASSYSNLDKAPGGFGDKTSAIRNNTSKAWRLYDDKDYKDRWVCIAPGQFQANLDAADFGDKMSSLKQLSTTTC